MPDFDRDVRLKADSHRFVNRLRLGVALAAHVRGVDAARLRCLAGQSDQLFGFGVGCGRILQGAGQPHRSILHGPPYQRLHLG